MPRPGVMLPVLQNWSCHNCGGCCREHQIGITNQEKHRIEQQGWSAADGVPTDRPLIVPFGKAHRLNQRDDGACVFLNDQGLCRIHAKFGEAAKPLACQIYPFAVHPAGDSLTVSLRFSCPSVVQNIGSAVSVQRPSIERLTHQILPSDYRTPEAPELFEGSPLAWDDFTKVVAYLDRGLADSRVGIATRLMRILSWMELLERASSDVLHGDRLSELLRLLHDASVRAQPEDDLPLIKPSRMGRLMFRQLVAQLVRHDTDATARGGITGRLRLLRDGLRHTMGRGRVPELQDPVSVQAAFPRRDAMPHSIAPRFRDLEAAFSGRNPEFNELFSRYFRVKVQGNHFCGAACYDMSVLDGFRSLALMYPVTQWVARQRAAREGRTALSLQDVQAALATVDHNFGYSPALGLRSSRRRIRQLSQLQQITALCGWYSL
jgi:lysine-N-methylase